MGKLKKAIAITSIIAALGLSSGCGLAYIADQNHAIKSTEQAIEMQETVDSLVANPGAPTPTPYPNSSYSLETQHTEIAQAPILTQTLTPAATQIDALTLRMIGEKLIFDYFGYTGSQMETYLDMSLEQKSKFYDLVELGGEDVDFYKLKLAPQSIDALWGYLQGFDSGLRKDILLQPNSPVNMIGSRLYVLNLSDNSSPYFLALASDVMSERFGLEEMLLVDNSEEYSPLWKSFEEYYHDDPHKIGMTVEDRVTEIINFRESHAGSGAGISDDGTRIMIDATMPEVSEEILRLEGIERSKGHDGPLTIYIIAHNHISASRILVNDGISENYAPDELFPKSFFRSLPEAHFNFVISTCSFGWIEGFKSYLDSEAVSYTIATSYIDETTGTALGDMANALEIASNVEPESIHPMVGLEELLQVADGTINGKELSVFDTGNTFLYSFWPYEIIDGNRERWNKDGISYIVYLEITHDGEQTIPLREGGTFTYKVGFDPAVLSNLPYQDQIALFGLNLKQMD